MKSVVSVSKQTWEKTSSTRPEPHKNSYLTSSKTGMRGEPGDRGRVPHVDTAALKGADFSLYFQKGLFRGAGTSISRLLEGRNSSQLFESGSQLLDSRLTSEAPFVASKQSRTSSVPTGSKQ